MMKNMAVSDEFQTDRSNFRTRGSLRQLFWWGTTLHKTSTLVFVFVAGWLSANSQTQWHRTIGGDSLTIQVFDVNAIDTNSFWVTARFNGLYDLNEGSGQPPLWVESLVDGDALHIEPSYFIGKMTGAGQFTELIQLDPSSGEQSVEISNFDIVGVNDNDELVAFLLGSGTGAYLDFDPGSGQSLMNLEEDSAYVAIYDSSGNLVRHGEVGLTAWPKAANSASGFYLHTYDETVIMNLSFQAPYTTVQILEESNQASVLAKYNYDLELQWYHVIGLEPNSVVASLKVFELEDGRVVWVVRNNDAVDVDVDPGVGVDILPGSSVGLVVYDSDGTYLDGFVYDQQLVYVEGIDIVEESSQIQIFGLFNTSQALDFDFSSETFEVTSFTYNRDFFIASYDLNFNLNWVNVGYGSSQMWDAAINASNGSNGIVLRHQQGGYDLDATSPGFYLVEDDGLTLAKSDLYGAPQQHVELSQYGITQFSENNSSAVFIRYKGASEPDLVANGVQYPFPVASEAIGLQLLGFGLEGFGRVNGRMFIDLNNNGVWDLNESAGIGEKMKCLELNGVCTADSSGQYHYSLGASEYNFQPILRPYRIVSTGQTLPIAVEVVNDATTTIGDIGIYTIPNITDLVANIGVLSPLRPGFNSMVHVNVENVGTIEASGTVALKVPDFGSISQVDPAPVFQSSDSIVWALQGLSPDESMQLTLKFQTGINVELIGDTGSFSMVVNTLVQDEYPYNNQFISENVVVGSYDPNDKQVQPTTASSESAFALGQWPLTYLIRFQNTGSYPTSFVHLIDTIGENLDLETFRMISSSHPYQYVLDPNGVITWGFDPLELPDSASDPEGSKGFVMFEINLKEGWLSGELVENRAYIYFDFNPPIITETATLQIHNETRIEEAMAGPIIMELYPNPFSTQTQLTYRSPQGTSPMLQLRDMLGRTVQTVQLPSNEGTHTLDAAGLGTGVYFCSLVSGAEVLVTQKLIVTKN